MIGSLDFVTQPTQPGETRNGTKNRPISRGSQQVLKMTFDYMPRELEAAVKAVSRSKVGGEKITPRELLLGVLAELQEELCQAVDQHCGRYTRDIESHIVSVDSSIEEKRMKLIHLAEAEKWFTEYGCTVCDVGPRGYELTDCAEAETGSGIQIEHVECFEKAKGVHIGSFHTHPYGQPTPSRADIMNVFIGNRKINFIGGLVGGSKVIVGYALRPDSVMRWEIKQQIEPYKGAVDAKNVVLFVYRPPGATSPDSLSVKQYEVWDEDEAIDHFVSDLEYLDGIFDVIVHWC